jgi:hypothetical protein
MVGFILLLMGAVQNSHASVCSEHLKAESEYTRVFTKEEISYIRERERLPEILSDGEVAQFYRNSAQLELEKTKRRISHHQAEVLAKQTYGLDVLSPQGKESVAVLSALIAGGVQVFPQSEVLPHLIEFFRLNQELNLNVHRLTKSDLEEDLEPSLDSARVRASKAERDILNALEADQLVAVEADGALLGKYIQKTFRLQPAWSGADSRVAALRDALARSGLPRCCQSGCLNCPYNYSTLQKLKKLGQRPDRLADQSPVPPTLLLYR